MEAVGKGTVELFMNVPKDTVKRCRLFDVLFMPQLSYILLSVSKATKSGKTFEFSQSGCRILDSDNRTVATAKKSGNLYHLNCARKRTTTNEVAMCGNKDSNEAIWHQRYGHLGVKNLERLANEHLVEGFDYNVSKKATF